MRTLMLLLALAAPFSGCVPTDVTGCPLDADEAVGTPCSDEGTQCGETSLCDPCTSDLSECELIECSNGAWEALDQSALLCADDAGNG